MLGQAFLKHGCWCPNSVSEQCIINSMCFLKTSARKWKALLFCFICRGERIVYAHSILQRLTWRIYWFAECIWFFQSTHCQHLSNQGVLGSDHVPRFPNWRPVHGCRDKGLRKPPDRKYVYEHHLHNIAINPSNIHTVFVFWAVLFRRVGLGVVFALMIDKAVKITWSIPGIFKHIVILIYSLCM